jgi:cobaltochelatase CobT
MAGPFPDRTVEAVRACTRALAGAPDADAMLPLADAATLGGLRAFGDRLAVRARFHDDAVHRAHRPGEAQAAWLFDATELARLDARGVRWLRGVGRNLMAHPGAEDDAPRWLAFELFSSRAAPGNKTGMVAAVRGGLPRPLLDTLASLAAHLEEQARFAAAAAEWARAASGHIAPPSTAHDTRDRFPRLRRKAGFRHLPRRGDPGGTATPLTRRPDAPQGAEGAGHAPGATVGASDAGAGTYRVYTTAHDRVVNAATLASREELAQLRLKLQEELSAIRPVVSRLAKRLLRVLMARQVREWRFDLEEGVLDGSRLAPLVASPGSARPFKAESDSPFPGTVVTLLIDHSGSMRGRPMLIAALTVEIFARVLERCGVRCEVLGFTTRDWDGGEPAREWAADGYPPNPGRLNALEHIVIKGADVPWRRARVALGLFLRDGMLKENIDGEAVSWAHGRLLSRGEPRRILVVVSDGTPMDEATMAANGHEYLEAHLQAVVDAIEARSVVQLAAIGIGHDVSAFYRNATRIASVDDLGPALTAKLTALLATPDAR